MEISAYYLIVLLERAYPSNNNEPNEHHKEQWPSG